jgi:hypothetical protein
MCCAFCPDLRWHMSWPGAWLLDDRLCTPEAGTIATMRGELSWLCN